MSDHLQIFPSPILPAGASVSGTVKVGGQPQGPSFESVLEGQLGRHPLKFSQHAQSRMASRGIEFGPEQLVRVENAVAQLQAKGGRDSLVMLDQTAMVVSVKNSTVVTVVDRNSLQNNVFTNIDSAIIA